MLLDKKGKLVKSLDFRGTSIERLDRLTAREIFLMVASALQEVNLKEKFKAADLAPSDWSKTAYLPIIAACDNDRTAALRLFGVIIKQALIMSPLLFSQENEGDFCATSYTRH